MKLLHSRLFSWGIAVLGVSVGCSSTHEGVPTEGEPLATPTSTSSPSAGPIGASPGRPPSPGTTATTTVPPAGSPPDFATPQMPPQPTLGLVRLSQRQWANTLRQLFPALDLGALEERVTKDALVGFDNEGAGLFVTERLRTDLQRISEEIATLVSADAEHTAALFPEGISAEAANVDAFITHFGGRVYRRPLAADEVAHYRSLFESARDTLPDASALQAGVEIVVATMLQSPYFLYRTEFGSDAGDRRVKLTPLELASKLSYTLTDSMPDEELMALAESSALSDSTVLQAQVQRLLASDTALEMLDNFTFQAFRMGVYQGISRNPESHPEFTSAVPEAAKRSALEFVRWVYRSGGGLPQLLTSKVAFVNADLAPLYGVTETLGRELQQVQLDPLQRAGLFTQVGHLMAYAKEDEVDSIRRGVFVNDRILCRELLVPNVDLPPLPPAEDAVTNRERVESFTGVGTCGAGCHGTLINPAGFAFENFDNLGRYQTMEKGSTIDASGEYQFQVAGKPELRSFSGAVEFMSIVSESEQAHACYAKNWFSYLYGRVPSANDEAFAHTFAVRSREGLSVRELVGEMVGHEKFRTRILGVAQ